MKGFICGWSSLGLLASQPMHLGSHDAPAQRLEALIDGVLEATVVLSFTDIGPMIRRRLFDWQDMS